MYYSQDVVISPDETHVVCYGFEKLKNHIYVHATKSGEFLHKILVKYSGKIVVVDSYVKYNTQILSVACSEFRNSDKQYLILNNQ